METKPKSNVLGILSVVFGSISLFFSWMPGIDLLFVIFGITGVILGLVGWLSSQVQEKLLPIIGFSLSIVSIIVTAAVMTLLIVCSNNYHERHGDTYYERSYHIGTHRDDD